MIRQAILYIRLLAALFLTAIVLPFLHAYLFYVFLYVGISPFFLAIDLIGIGLIALLARGFRAVPIFTRRRRLIAVLIALLWFAGSALTIGPLLELHVPIWSQIAIAAVASLWQPWLAWMHFCASDRSNRLAVLALLIVLQGIYPLAFRIDGVTGADLFIVRWRNAAPFAPVATELGSEWIEEPTADFPQYLGPGRNASLEGISLDPDWQSQPPKLLWRRPVGAGWGAFAVAKKLAVTQEQRGDQESVVCYELLTGKEVWRHSDQAAFTNSMGGPGPRATPTISGDTIFALGATGILNCLRLATGTKFWSTSVLNDVNAATDDNGVTSSPLVIGDLVIVGPTGSSTVSLVAYDRETGKARWQSSGAKASYSSPCVATMSGFEQIIHLNGSGLAGYQIESGAMLWQFPFNPNGNNCPQPILRPGGLDAVFVSTDRDGAALIDVIRTGGQWSAKERWHRQLFRTKFSTPVYYKGHVYGLDAGILACIRLVDGKLLWKEGRYQHGQMLLVAPYLLVLSESGELVLIEPNPEGKRELGRFAAIEGKTWNNIALAGDLVVVRNAEQAACFRLPLQANVLQSSAMEK